MFSRASHFRSKEYRDGLVAGAGKSGSHEAVDVLRTACYDAIRKSGEHPNDLELVEIATATMLALEVAIKAERAKEEKEEKAKAAQTIEIAVAVIFGLFAACVVAYL